MLVMGQELAQKPVWTIHHHEMVTALEANQRFLDWDRPKSAAGS